MTQRSIPVRRTTAACALLLTACAALTACGSGDSGGADAGGQKNVASVSSPSPSAKHAKEPAKEPRAKKPAAQPSEKAAQRPAKRPAKPSAEPWSRPAKRPARPSAAPAKPSGELKLPGLAKDRRAYLDCLREHGVKTGKDAAPAPVPASKAKDVRTCAAKVNGTK